MKARIALVSVVLLFPVGSAQAAVTIGNNPLPEPTAGYECIGGCTMSPDTVPGGTAVAPDTGVITRWRVRVGNQATVPVQLQVIHAGAEAARSTTVTPPTGGTTVYPSRIPIGALDRIALMWSDQAGGTFTSLSTPGTTDVWMPVLGTVSRTPELAGQDIEVAVNADWEPDADGDVFGDETQDNCAGVANADQANRDHDGRGDACDVCPDVAGTAPNGCPVAASPPPPKPNQPPVVRFREPLSGTRIGTSFRIVLDVADDTGSPTVTLFDDDGTICTLRRAPYACTWTPTGDDVGRATLLASAVDAGGLSTLGIVRVRVERFSAHLTRPKTKRLKRRRLRVSGRLVLPAVVTAAQGCAGEITVRVRKARATVRLTSRCTYSARLKVRTGRPRVTFGGNSVIAPT